MDVRRGSLENLPCNGLGVEAAFAEQAERRKKSGDDSGSRILLNAWLNGPVGLRLFPRYAAKFISLLH